MILLYFCPRTLRILLSWHLPDSLSHQEPAQVSLVRPYLEFWFKKMSLWISYGETKGNKTPALTFGVSLGLGAWCSEDRGQDSGWHKDMENSRGRARASKDWGPGKPGTGIAGYLTKNTHSFSLGLGSGSEQAVLEGSTSFLLSPPQLQSSSQTSASNLSPCLCLIAS